MRSVASWMSRHAAAPGPRGITGSRVPMHDEVGEAREGIPVRTRTDVVERLEGPSPETVRIRPREFHGPRAANQREATGDRPRGSRIPPEDPRELRPSLDPVVHRVKHEQGHVPLPEVRPHRLPEDGRIADDVEDVVHDLERDPEVQSVFREGLDLLRLPAAEDRADARARAD